MITSYWDSLQESLGRRVALVLIGLALVTSVGFNLLVTVEKLPGGQFKIVLGNSPLPRDMGLVAMVHNIVSQQMGIAGTLWILGALFAAAPLFSSALEKGWLELLFSKGTSRWRIFLGRYLAGATLYAMTFALATFPLAVRLWWKTDVRVWQIGVALLLFTLSFASLLSVGALASLSQRGVSLPILGSVAIWLFSPVLAHRGEMKFWPWVLEAFDWAYRILPKCDELSGLASAYMKNGQITAWWPVWSTSVFTVVVLGFTLWSVERKSF
jgi:ABC-type transport system involved in multi-copper enzyme maturation permease subunit